MTKIANQLDLEHSDRGPRGRWPREGSVKRAEDREDKKIWDPEVLHKR